MTQPRTSPRPREPIAFALELLLIEVDAVLRGHYQDIEKLRARAAEAHQALAVHKERA